MTSVSLGRKRKRRRITPLLKRTKKGSLRFLKKMVNFSPLNMSVKDDPNLKWLKPITSLPHRQDQKKYCQFHKDHSHIAEECRDLKGLIEELKQRGKLQKFMKNDHHHHWTEEKPKQANIKKDDEQENIKAIVGEIRMIIEGPVTKGSFNSL